ncbi:MAG: type II toxin-antitoxin system RelE/ParE family toxin [Gammaproteobacteria bacterium]|nr:type II toxin-antitoxin system RelE/ParE family toxin [Gammaproteobacteria bacterium]
METTYKKKTLRTLRKMQKAKAKTIVAGMKEVAKDPFKPDVNIKPLLDVENGYRKRFGDIRVLYTVDTEIKILEIFKIGNRGDVYKK